MIFYASKVYFEYFNKIAMLQYLPSSNTLGQGLSSMFFGELTFVLGGFISNYLLKKKVLSADANPDLLDN